MQPQLRQIPPRCSRSTSATFILSCAARIAATYPPGPPPTTMRSKSCSAMIRPPLEQHRQRIFDQALEGLEEGRTNRAVDHAMVDRQRAGHDRRDGQRAVLDDRTLFAGADRQDGAVRRIDDGGEFLDAEHAEVRDREGAALELL